MKTNVGSRVNRTGLSVALEMAKELIEGASNSKPSSPGDATALNTIRKPYIQGGEVIGSQPPSPGPDAPSVFLDKLGARLAYERSAVRLYEGLLGKMESSGPPKGGPSARDVKHIMDEEAEHFSMLTQAIAKLGGDPTMETPTADLDGVAGIGIVQVLSDPRTTVAECLHAMLTAELTDNDGWQMLITMADGLGHEELVPGFETALENEQEHLEKVRGWVMTLTEAEMGRGPKPEARSSRGQSEASTSAKRKNGGSRKKRAA